MAFWTHPNMVPQEGPRLLPVMSHNSSNREDKKTTLLKVSINKRGHILLTSRTLCKVPAAINVLDSPSDCPAFRLYSSSDRSVVLSVCLWTVIQIMLSVESQGAGIAGYMHV